MTGRCSLHMCWCECVCVPFLDLCNGVNGWTFCTIFSSCFSCDFGLGFWAAVCTFSGLFATFVNDFHVKSTRSRTATLFHGKLFCNFYDRFFSHFFPSHVGFNFDRIRTASSSCLRLYTADWTAPTTIPTLTLAFR